MRKVFVHLHIPKCGGSTVSDYLARNFGQHLGNTNSILNDYQYDADQVSRIIDQSADLKCLTGHKLSLDLPFQRSDLELHAFTWIRDPVDRFVSHYFYHRNHTTIVPEAKTMELPDYTLWALRDGHQEMYINGQTRFLSSGGLDVIRQTVADGHLLLFPLTRLADAIYTLTQQFPQDFADLEIESKNVSKKDQNLPENYRDLVLPYVSDDLELLAMSEATPLMTKPASAATHSAQPAPNSLKSLAGLPIRKLGSVLVRCGNYLSRIG